MPVDDDVVEAGVRVRDRWRRGGLHRGVDGVAQGQNDELAIDEGRARCHFNKITGELGRRGRPRRAVRRLGEVGDRVTFDVGAGRCIDGDPVGRLVDTDDAVVRCRRRALHQLDRESVERAHVISARIRRRQDRRAATALDLDHVAGHEAVPAREVDRVLVGVDTTLLVLPVGRKLQRARIEQAAEPQRARVVRRVEHRVFAPADQAIDPATALHILHDRAVRQVDQEVQRVVPVLNALDDVVCRRRRGRVLLQRGGDLDITLGGHDRRRGGVRRRADVALHRWRDVDRRLRVADVEDQ